MLPTKVCMFHELLETILLFHLRYLHLDLFQFLHMYLSLHVQFCLCVFQGKIGSQFWNTVSVIRHVSGDHLAFTSHALAPHYSLLFICNNRALVTSAQRSAKVRALRQAPSFYLSGKRFLHFVDYTSLILETLSFHASKDFNSINCSGQSD